MKTHFTKKKYWTRSRVFILFAIPGTFMYAFFTIQPVILGIWYSLTDWNGYSPTYHFIKLRNYVKIFHDTRIFSSLSFTFRYAFALVVLVILLSLILALLLDAKIKGITLFRAVYFFPAVLSMLTVGLIFNQIYFRAMPVIAKVTGLSFLNGILASPEKAFWGILFVNLWQGLTIPSILLLAGLQTVPQNLIEAAVIDGASFFQRFIHIKVPFLLPTLSVVFVLTLKSGILVFDYIMSMTSGGPGGSTISIAYLIYQHAFTENRFSYSIAESIIIGIIVTLISVLQIKAANKKEVSL
ncbi:MAG: sugar ABC transporter permease [Treponema sp.]|jgi:raffinose/stachyose/melibiose transport system permease protein|nr:sugar ABC transporter permease [Treponema sp.]